MEMSILAGVAHIDRCLFPGDFVEEMVELGLDKDIAKDLAKDIPKGKGIVEIYQHALQFNEPWKTEICDALDKYLKDFQTKYEWNLEK